MGSRILSNTPISLQIEGHGFVKYGERSHGINLVWSEKPIYQWKLIKKKDTSHVEPEIKSGDTVALYNMKQSDYVVYAERSTGINLRWLRDQSSIPQDDPYNWTIFIDQNTGRIKLKNRSNNKFLVYSDRSWGISLGWNENSDYNVSVKQADTTLIAKTILPNTPISLQIVDHGFVKYGDRANGIDLVWSEKPIYQWKLIRKKDTSHVEPEIKSGDKVALYNLKEHDYVVHAKRGRGINLRWLRDQSSIPQNDPYNWTIFIDQNTGRIKLKNRSNNKFLVYSDRSSVLDSGINLGWNENSDYNLSVKQADATLIVKTIVCHVTEDWCEADEIYIKINGDTVWGPHDLNTGETYHLYKQIPVKIGEKVEISVNDEDVNFLWLFDKDDNLGKQIKYVTIGEGLATFSKDEAYYSFYYSVEYKNAPAKLSIVEPSLGHPHILKPSDLNSFWITIATKSVLGDVQKAFNEIQDKIFIEDIETRRKWPCIVDLLSLFTARDNYFKSKEMYNEKRNEVFNKNPSQFPFSNTEFKACCGIIADFKVKLKLQPKHINELVESEGLQRMFNLHLGNYTAFHCVYISQKLPDEHDIKFIHATDSHITDFYDTIGDDILDHPQLTDVEKHLMLSNFRNPNDHLRAIISYANSNNIDFLVITGDLIDWQSDMLFDIAPPNQSNFRKFHSIITGSDNLGEPLRCPLFVVPGNHDFLCFAPPLRYTVDSPVGDEDLEDNEKATGLNTKLGSKKYIDLLEKHKPLKEKYMRRTHGLYVAYRFLQPTFPQFSQYLTELSYEPSFSVDIGKHHLVLLNTGQDVLLPGLNIKGIFDYIVETDAVEHGTHNAGFSREDILLVDEAKKNSKKGGLICVFTHAPLINPEKHQKIPKEITEFYHESFDQIPNKVTLWLMKLANWYPAGMVGGLPAAVIAESAGFSASLKSAGFPQASTRYFFRGKKRSGLLDFACADKNYRTFLFSLLKKESGQSVAALFSGHTHKIHEFRISQNQTHDEFCIFTENYSGSESWTELSEGYPEYQLPAKNNLVGWLNEKAPLLLTSGALKGQKYPQFREVNIEGDEYGSGISSMEMKQISRYSHYIPAPQQLKPSDGTFFYDNQRKIKFSWKHDLNASKYKIEIQYNDETGWHPCIFTNTTVETIVENSFTCDFIKSRVGRWRVWVVDKYGQEGIKSGWSRFVIQRLISL